MTNKKFGGILLFTLFTFTFGLSNEVSAATSVFVKDEADILSPETEQKIVDLNENTFKSYASFPQLAVYTVENLPEGFDIDSYTNELFEQLGVGQEDYDNGLLFVISEQDRVYRLETGYGMEHIIVDGMHNRIVDDYAMGYLKGNNFDGAVNVVVDNIGTIVNESEYGLGSALTVDEREQIALEQQAIEDKESEEFKSSLLKGLGALASIGAVGGTSIYAWREKRKKERKEALKSSSEDLFKVVAKDKPAIETYLVKELQNKVATYIKNYEYKFKLLDVDMGNKIKVVQEEVVEENKTNWSTENVEKIIFNSLNDPLNKTKEDVLETKTELITLLTDKDYNLFTSLINVIPLAKHMKGINDLYSDIIHTHVTEEYPKYESAIPLFENRAKASSIEELNKTIEALIIDIETTDNELEIHLNVLKSTVVRADDDVLMDKYNKVLSEFSKDRVQFSSDMVLKNEKAYTFVNQLESDLANKFVERAVRNSHVSQQDASRFLSTNSSKSITWFQTKSKREIAEKYAKYHRRKERERDEERRKEIARQAALAASSRNNSSSSGGGGSSMGGGSSGGGGFSGGF